MDKKRPSPGLDTHLTSYEQAIEGFKAAKELAAMSREELNKVPFDKVHVWCAEKNCKHKFEFKDYKASPYYGRGGKLWDLSRYRFFCNKHLKMYRKSGEENMELRPGPSLNHFV